METVWGTGEVTVGQVREHLNRTRSLAYTTVLSVMQKLEKGGWLTHRRSGRSYIYRAVRSRREEGLRSLRRFTQRVFGGDLLVLFQHLLEDEALEEKDLRRLEGMIRQRRIG
jgi:predicted transcriptional regulator